MNEYPKFLENHSTDTFSFENRSAHLNERKAYFHEQYPLLMHQHDFHEVNIIVKGNGRHYIKNKTIRQKWEMCSSFRHLSGTVTGRINPTKCRYFIF